MGKSKGRVSEYKSLLEDKEVKRWYENIARGSILTADVYLRRLGNFCKHHKITPKELAKKSEKELYNILLDHVTELEKKKKAGSYIKSITKSVKSWLIFNDKDIKKKIKIRGIGDTPTLRDERIPSPDELRSILFSGDKKTRAACVLVAHSGLRIECIGAYKGDDGLRIGDLPELKVKGDTVEFKNIPSMVIVRSELSKAGHQYMTFISEEGCEYIKDYLEERLRGGEKLTKTSPLIRPKTAKKPFISSTNVSDAIRSALRKAGFSWRPYTLRSYFATQLMLSESKGLSLRDYRTFWMGHKGDIENVYTTHRGKQSEQVIEDMREAYRKSQELLQTKVPGAPPMEEYMRRLRYDLLILAGYTEEQIKKDMSNLTDAEFYDIIQGRMPGKKTNNENNQKVVNIDELGRYLSEGWEYVTSVNSNKAIIRRLF